MDDNQINETIDAWIAAHTAPEKSPERKEFLWATRRVMDWTYDNQADLLWRFIVGAYRRELPDNTLAVLAAGPLEDLISKFGAQYIDRIEALARQDPKFNDLLCECQTGGESRLAAFLSKM